MILAANPWPRQTVVATFLIAACLGSCNAPGPTAPVESTTAGAVGIEEHLHTGNTQGTTYLIKYLGDVRVDQSRIDSVLEAVDVEFNLWRPASRINAINEYAGGNDLYTFVDSSRLWSVIWSRSLDLFEASQGAFDPTVHPLVELWGFGLSEKGVVNDEDVRRILPSVGMTADRIDLEENEADRIYQDTYIRKGNPSTSIDFNGIAQGLTVDLLADALLEEGVSNFMVEVGGEVKCQGLRSDGQVWRIAIDLPVDQNDGLDERQLQSIVAVKDAAICTSGNYRKFYEEDGIKRSHTISPFTGYPVQHSLLSATIQAADAATADALATACMVWGPEEGKRFIETYRSENEFERIEALFIFASESGAMVTWQTQGWDEALSADS
ncbi:FAD:protein FMN transferase [Flavobacteriales bacterium]|nr:FAD:protein FMN transferase [Flavobacteriales bacterium]